MPPSTDYPDETTVAISGGGPAGMMLGLLLARAGVDVTVVEKHSDFFNDFRGDTLHPSTRTVLDQIGLGAEVERIPHRKVRRITVGRDSAEISADLAALSLEHPYIAMVPQWDFLEMLARRARSYPGFRLLMAAESTELIREGAAVRGLRFSDGYGVHDLRSVLTVSADGRRSPLREQVGLHPHSLGSPMDVLWLRVSRGDEQVEGLNGRAERGAMAFAIDRGDYWQIAFVIGKGGFDGLRAGPVEGLQSRLSTLLPFLGQRVQEIRAWDDVALLDVRLERLARWHRPGYLCIGDAAHAMTPVGGVGINLAVQDAVATANLLAEPLARAQRDPRRLAKTLNPELLAQVQRRRNLPSVGTQMVQQFMQRELFGSVVPGTAENGRPPAHRRLADAALGSPAGARAANRVYSALISRVMLRGLRPEHVASPEQAVPDAAP
ncbi:FAD-dependent oxidoreductase [Nocardiopsis coralliicola]